MKTWLQISLGTAGGGAVGVAGSAAYLATERCAGPACAGLAIVPIAMGCVGLVVGLVGSIAWVLFVRPKPMPRAFVDEAQRRRD